MRSVELSVSSMTRCCASFRKSRERACPCACSALRIGLTVVAATQHKFDIGAFRGNGFGRGEPAPRSILRSLHHPKIACCAPGLELRSNLPIPCLSHPPAHGVAQDSALIDDGLPLKDALAGEGHGFLGLGATLLPNLLMSGAFSCSSNNLFGLIANSVAIFLWASRTCPAVRFCLRSRVECAAISAASAPVRPVFSSCSRICRERGLEASRYSSV